MTNCVDLSLDECRGCHIDKMLNLLNTCNLLTILYDAVFAVTENADDYVFVVVVAYWEYGIASQCTAC
jgi:hypothetical protein